MRDLEALSSLCEERLRGIRVPQPFDLAGFAAAVGRRLCRDVRLDELPPEARRAGISGAWAGCVGEDVIMLDPAASQWHRNQIAVHELAHLIWRRAAQSGACNELAAELFPHLSPAVVRHFVGRQVYMCEEELEVEMTASLILARADSGPPPDLDSGDDPLLSRLTEALRHPIRHV